MDDKYWLPLIGVAVGWVLNQLGQWFVFRREERKAIGKALADLLDIRHRLIGMTKAVDALSHRFGIPAEAKPFMRTVFEQFFPPDADLGKRYNESVALVAAVDPVLGFRLRSQDTVSPMLHQLRAMALANGPEGGLFIAKLESELMSHFDPHLERLIRLLAKQHSWVTWWRVDGLLKKPLELPDGFLDALAEAIPKPPQPETPSTGQQDEALKGREVPKESVPKER